MPTFFVCSHALSHLCSLARVHPAQACAEIHARTSSDMHLRNYFAPMRCTLIHMTPHKHELVCPFRERCRHPFLPWQARMDRQAESAASQMHKVLGLFLPMQLHIIKTRIMNIMKLLLCALQPLPGNACHIASLFTCPHLLLLNRRCTLWWRVYRPSQQRP